jgi:hypothetical protein
VHDLHDTREPLEIPPLGIVARQNAAR